MPYFSHLISCVFIVFGLFVSFVCVAEVDYADTTHDGSGAVASVNPLATQIGLDTFKKGGNAIDAAVATAFALGVVDGFNSGVGGGCFILVHTADGKVLAIDGREMAPAAAHRDMYLVDGKADANLSRHGALAIGVPGSVKAMYELQKQAGNLSFEEVILPSVPLAENGFRINELYAARLDRASKKLSMYESSSAIFQPKGRVLKSGDLLVQKDLANTYKKLAKKGPKYFYRGEFAKKVDKWMSTNGGIVTHKDFKHYKIKNREPIHSTFYGYDVYGFPTPSSGGIHVAQILEMMSHYPGSVSAESNDLYHWYIESSKLAFADRAYWLGDADFVDVPKGLLNASYLKDRIKGVNLDTASFVDGHGLPQNFEEAIFNRHTTHLTAADKEGNWVAITTTLNTTFGSGVTIPGTGVMMNNQMDDFSTQPGVPNAFGLVGYEANAVEGKKRPLSSMSPTIVLKEGKPVLTVGAAGGPTIISQVAQTLMNNLMLDLPIKDALSRARVHNQWKPNRTFIDGFADQKLKDTLSKKGHELMTWPRFGGTQAIALEDGKLVPQSEPRIQ